MQIDVTNFINLSSDRLLEILEWRNSASVRRYSLDQKNVSLAEHLDFIERLKIDRSKAYYRVSLKTKEAFGNGVIHFNNLTAASANIGLYKDERSTLPKTGTFLMRLLLIEAEQKGLKTIKLKTLKENERALGLYKKFHFETAFEEETILYMQKEI
ncbi:MAG: hypothetical protein LBQ52_04215 [Helicobacteraceae bacterium]|jgi:UDP-4-amino-4,6-dideoxy-N-acetyl-beta-L-altrosamine N-acetyltransferase|nr:hypothetical protein [Helicobacteraceae bacterium]